MSRKLAVLVREDEDVIAKNDEEVAEFLTLTTPVHAIVLKDAGMAPKLKERALAKPLKIPLAWRTPRRPHNGGAWRWSRTRTVELFRLCVHTIPLVLPRHCMVR
jgi:hypothetical protein